LTVIVGWAGLLIQRSLDPAMLQNGAEVILRNAQMQAVLVEDLLDASRIVTGKLRLKVQPVDPGKAISAVIEGLCPTAQAKEISLQLQPGPPAGQVLADPDRLQQIIWNLVSNAIKFTPRGGRVLVQLARAEASIEITVSDNGRGITPDFLPHVFDRFRQADSTSTRSFGGLGLGLSIVHQLVELHGGTVRARSEGTGRGSTFTVSLPAIAPRRAGADDNLTPLLDFKAPQFSCPPELKGLRVLVVDDEPDTCALLRVILEGCGAQVHTSGSVADALEALAEQSFDVLISDIGLPDEDGYSLLAKARVLTGERGAKLPAAALTAYVSEKDRIRAFQAGFQIHVPKPFSASEVVAVVANLAGQTT
ncbi:MAG TPA: ATP-binding protein, partial [Abditibacteriaceae bacterium]